MTAKATIVVASANFGSVSNSKATPVLSHKQSALMYSYLNATMVAFINENSKNQWFYDIATLSEVRVTILNKSLSDPSVITDDNYLEFFRAEEDAISFLETFKKVMTFNRSFDDVFTMDDASLIDKDFFGNKGNVTRLLDIVGLEHDKVLSDSYTVGDVISKVTLFSRTFNDSFNFGDNAATTFNKVKSNIFSVGDSYRSSFTKVEDDSYGFTDLTSYDIGLNKISDISFVEDYITDLSKVISDSFTMDDSALVDKDFFGNKGNTFGFSDIVVQGVGKAISDPTNISDVINLFNGKELSDSTVLNDSIASEVTKVISDAFTLDDSALVDKGFFGNKGNVIAFTEVLVVVTSYNKTYADSFGFSEVKGLALSKIFAERINVFDDPLFDGSINNNILNNNLLNGPASVYNGEKATKLSVSNVQPDTLTFSESSIFAYNKGINDSLGLSDNDVYSLSKNTSDSFGLGDNTDRNIGKSNADGITLAEMYINNFGKALPDSVALSDSIGRHFTKVESDAFTLDDSALIDKDYFGNKGNILSMNDLVAVTRVARRLLNGASFNKTQLN